MDVGDNLCVYSVCVCLGFRRRKTELTRYKSERHHLPGEGYISAMDVKVHTRETYYGEFQMARIFS